MQVKFPVLLGLMAVAWMLGVPAVSAHMLNITQAQVEFDESQEFKATIQVDFSRALNSSEAYYQLSILPHDQQEKKIRELVEPLLSDLQFTFGDQIVKPELVNWDVPKASHEVYSDYYTGKMTKIELRGEVPPGRQPFVLNTLAQSTIEYPLALTVMRRDHNIHVTRWLELQGISSDPFNYDQGTSSGQKDVASHGVDPLSGATLSPTQRYWYVQLGALWIYLRLGFHHIVPEGTDHILFVLGLFFLGISWRKLISQTTVFTVAHATTLYLSSQNIFSLPTWLVEPGIALSIMFIALENIFKPKLNAFRLAVVFCFGLIHGLGFAAGLKQLPLPKHEFLMALFGFNFGVDFGQLFIILLAFLTVGWFRNKPWYFSRIAVPGSAVIAAFGFFWAVQRIFFYTHIISSGG
jgi:HupE / UreJ protein